MAGAQQILGVLVDQRPRFCLAPDTTMLAQLASNGPDDTTPVARLLAGVFEDAVRSRAFAPFRRFGQRFLYRWYYLRDEML